MIHNVTITIIYYILQHNNSHNIPWSRQLRTILSSEDAIYTHSYVLCVVPRVYEISGDNNSVQSSPPTKYKNYNMAGKIDLIFLLGKALADQMALLRRLNFRQSSHFLILLSGQQMTADMVNIIPDKTNDTSQFPVQSLNRPVCVQKGRD